MQTTNPHYREAAAAEAAVADFYGTVWKPKPGDRVRAELPFKDTHGIGTVVSVTPAVVVVAIDGETLWYYAHELEYVGPGN